MLPPLKQTMKKAFTDPKAALLYLLVGERKYKWLTSYSNQHTCYLAKNPNMPFASHMMKETDIHEHLSTLYMLTVEFNLRTVLELGTRGGESTISLLYAAREIDGRVFSIDLDDCDETKKLVMNCGLEKYWRFTQSDDLKVEWSLPIDHLFIDTSHTYDQTLEELVKFEPFVNPGGIISLHDSVTFPEVSTAVQKYLKTHDYLKAYEYINNNGLIILFKRS